MSYRFKLSSGNYFHYTKEQNGIAAYGIFIDNNLNFLGGVLGKELERKIKTFTQFNCVLEPDRMPDFRDLDLSQFASKLGSLEHYFYKSRDIFISDYGDCYGTSSKAQSCSERQSYYRAAGLDYLYGTYTKFPLMIFISNHLAIFSAKDFRKTFFGGLDHFISDQYASTKSRYADIDFKAPAYYVRSLLSN